MLLWNVGRLRDFSKSSCHQTICQLCGADEGKNSRPFFKIIVFEYGKFSIPFPFWLGGQMQLLPIKAIHYDFILCTQVRLKCCWLRLILQFVLSTFMQEILQR